MQTVTLSKADSKVLAQVFDPEGGPAKAEVLVDPALPADRHIRTPDLLQELKARERSAIQLIEAFEKSSDKVQQRSKIETYQKAIRILDDLVDEYPDYASARNNRAQLRLSDLQKCISLASPSSPRDAVSPAQGRLLAQAHTQLGALYHAAARDFDGDAKVVCDSLSGASGDVFEEEASKMFHLGGLYGNEVAKVLAVHTNPHAKLCGSIVKEAMRKEVASM